MRSRCVTFHIILLFLLVLFNSCNSFPILGERIALEVKNKDGDIEKVYIKSNNDDVAISEVPNMQGWWDDPHTAIPSGLIILYKNTIDTLYVVWFATDHKTPPLKTNANVVFIYEPGYNPEIVATYLSKGFNLFPKSHYQ